MDLENLPCLLVVVDKVSLFQTALLSFFYQFFFKGKMGITYPRSLKYYDLRQRYPRPNQGTRAAIEQVEHP